MLSTAQIDIEDFKTLRNTFYGQVIAFKSGNLDSGVLALSTLREMYLTLVYQHLEDKGFEAQINENIGKLISFYRKRRELDKEEKSIPLLLNMEFMQLMSDFDKVEKNFYDLKKKVGINARTA